LRPIHKSHETITKIHGLISQKDEKNKKQRKTKMNLQQLQYLEKIAETRNFTRAAEEMNVTQPALSKAISKLEEELEVELFTRSGRNVEFTESGETFLVYAKKALEQIQKGVLELNKMKKPDEHVLSVSTTPCIGTNFMPFIISGFIAEHNDIKVQFRNQNPVAIFEALKNGEIDFGFFDERDKRLSDKEIQSIPIKREEYVLIVPKNHWLSGKEEVSLKDIKEESCIVFSKGELKGSKNEKVPITEFIGNSKKIMVHPDQMHMLGALVAANVGITIVPNTPMINESKVSIVKLKEDIGYKTIYIGWMKKKKQTQLFEAFLTYVKTKMDEV